MKRTTTIAIVGAVAGSTLLVGAKLAMPALAHEQRPGFDYDKWCRSAEPSHPGKPSFSMPPGAGHPTAPPSFSLPPGITAPPSFSIPPTMSPPPASLTASPSESEEYQVQHSKKRRHHPRHCPSGTPTGRPTESTSPTAGPSDPTSPPETSPTPTAPPSSSGPASPSCSTVAGNATNVASPGVGAVTVTVKVCDGAVSTATSKLSQSNWDDNTAALPALDQLAVQYYKADVTKIHYSGATLTSNAYQTSLKSALSKAGL